MAIAHFVKQEEVYPLAKKHFEIEKARILKSFPDAIVEFVGSSSIPGALTLGDLDIQVRVARDKFDEVVAKLKEFYHVNRPERWEEGLALLHWKDHPEIPMSIVVTVIDSPNDNYHKERDLFKNNPHLLEKYNNLKRGFEGKSVEDYKAAKRKLFGPHGEVKSWK
ncbi:MAG TPA: GrpB family protein [Candidatus Paceibacterota bacterium]